MKGDNDDMDLEIRHLKLVREVSAAGSLTRAGAALHLTQSALSHQLRDIESRLGTALFLRVGKRMMLTPAGERLLRSADEVLATIERTEDAIRQLGGAKRGVLRITTECYTCYHWLPPLLKRYRRAHPLVDVRIDAAATAAPIAHLLDGRLDLAIVSDPVRDRRIVVTPLFDDEMVVIVEPRHPLASRSYVRPEDLADRNAADLPAERGEHRLSDGAGGGGSGADGGGNAIDGSRHRAGEGRPRRRAPGAMGGGSAREGRHAQSRCR